MTTVKMITLDLNPNENGACFSETSDSVADWVWFSQTEKLQTYKRVPTLLPISKASNKSPFSSRPFNVTCHLLGVYII